ncbi:hypothetical protein C1H71_10335 [Iodobacter fluviatilis]|jgi:hypothetical protein|uniref:Uncharacterized protein n=1 Tax=Iodobacter fluviatilis TaxID=537 RepID=A0A7G3GAZ4_9NEIS|nr:hypothetical protein C1H71_10335 [Iodobacter fluviatilis]
MAIFRLSPSGLAPFWDCTALMKRQQTLASLDRKKKVFYYLRRDYEILKSSFVIFSGGHTIGQALN